MVFTYKIRVWFTLTVLRIIANIQIDGRSEIKQETEFICEDIEVTLNRSNNREEASKNMKYYCT